MLRAIVLLSFFLLLNLTIFCTAKAEMGSERPQSPIEAVTDKSNYYAGESVEIKGNVPELEDGREVNVIVKDSNGKTFAKLKIMPAEDGAFTTSFSLPPYGKLYPSGNWTIRVSYALWTLQVHINVLPTDTLLRTQVDLSKPQIVSGSATNGMIKVGNEVEIRSELKNMDNREQAIFYTLQIKYEGMTILLDSYKRTLHANTTSYISTSWTPDIEGVYIIETFVWHDMVDPIPLSIPQLIEVEVF
jgi:hypothetical protein